MLIEHAFKPFRNTQHINLNLSLLMLLLLMCVLHSQNLFPIIVLAIASGPATAGFLFDLYIT